MRFKREENEMMWEAFVKPYDNRLSDETSGENYYDTPNTLDPTVPDDDEEGVMLEIEPEGELEVDEVGEDVGEIDEVLLSDLKKLADYSQKLLDVCKTSELDTWMIAKLIKASDYVSDVWHRLDAKADFANDGFEQSDNMSL